MRKTEMEKGITLLALIITIVVLLILASVTIGAIKNSGIIGHASNSSDVWGKAQDSEKSVLQEYEDILSGKSGAKVEKYVGDVPIPVGFEYLEGTKDEGLVIKNKTEGSEFVWIPVESSKLPDITGSEPAAVTGGANRENPGGYHDDVSENLVKAGMPANSTSTDFLDQLSNEYHAMVTSVYNYKGFYVGRYEVSIGNNGNAQSVAGVLPATADSSSADTWYGLYKLCKTYKTSSVTSSMVWGTQYEAMMDFIGNDEAESSGRVSHNSSSIYLTGNGKGEEQYSGDIEYNDIINNIYDLEGNVTEWTMEADLPWYRIYRGFADYEQGERPNPKRKWYYCPSDEVDIGSRMTLYVELPDGDGEKVMPEATVGTIVGENSTINGKNYSSNNPIIPKGFKAINVTTAGHKSLWDAKGGPQVTEGLVISDGNSEFVWIPVPELNEFARATTETDANGNTNYQGVLYDFSEKTATEMSNYGQSTTSYREPANSSYDSDTKISMWTPNLYQESFNKMVKSVAEYGGFYVGRYETSMNGSIAQSKAGETPLSGDWFTMYSNSLTYSKSGLKSEMIWGCQWDAMMKFILKGTEGDLVTESYNGGSLTICSNIYNLRNDGEYTQEARWSDVRVYRGESKMSGRQICYPYSWYSSRLTIYIEV